MGTVVYYAFTVIAAIVAVVLHELSHALVSTWLGDSTPRETGRLTLNPLRHLDPIGVLCLIIFGFGWAKPVMIDPSNYKNRKWGTALVSIAGPLINFILAILAIITIGILGLFSNEMLNGNLSWFLQIFSYINIGFGVFNLLPIPPLDGSKVIGSILPMEAYDQYMSYQRYGMFIMLGFILLLNVLEMTTGIDIIGIVIEGSYDFFLKLILKLFGIVVT